MKSLPLWGALLLAFVVGSMMAVQSRVNGELADRLDDPFTGTALVFLAAFLVMLVSVAFWRPFREGVTRAVRAVRTQEMPWWILSGGLVGATYVLTQSLVVSTLGVALFSVAAVGGQTVGGALMDRTRIVPGGPYALTPARAAGASLAIIAVAVTQWESFRTSVPPWMLLLPIAVGLAQGWQQAVNARVRVEAQSTFAATFFNGAIGLLILIPAAVLRVASSSVPTDFPTEWWLYSGGVLGIVFIALAAIAVQSTGALLYTLVAVTGQLGASLLLDFLNPSADPVPTTTIVGVSLALVAVVVGSLRRRPPFMRRKNS